MIVIYLIIGILTAEYGRKKHVFQGLTNLGFILNYTTVVIAWPIMWITWINQEIK